MPKKKVSDEEYASLLKPRSRSNTEIVEKKTWFSSFRSASFSAHKESADLSAIGSLHNNAEAKQIDSKNRSYSNIEAKSTLVTEIKEGTLLYAATVIVQKSVHLVTTSFLLSTALGGLFAGFAPELFHLVYYSLFDDYKKMGIGQQSQIALKTKALLKRVKGHFDNSKAPDLTPLFIICTVFLFTNLLKIFLQLSVQLIRLFPIRYFSSSVFLHSEHPFLVIFLCLSEMLCFTFFIYSKLNLNQVTLANVILFTKEKLMFYIDSLPAYSTATSLLFIKSVLHILQVKSAVESLKVYLVWGDTYHLHRTIVGCTMLFVQYCIVNLGWLRKKSEDHNFYRGIVALWEVVRTKTLYINITLFIWPTLSLINFFIYVLQTLTLSSVEELQPLNNDDENYRLAANRLIISRFTDSLGVISAVCVSILIDQLRSIDTILALFGHDTVVFGAIKAAKSLTINIIKKPQVVESLSRISPPIDLARLIFRFQCCSILIGFIFGCSSEIGTHSLNQFTQSFKESKSYSEFLLQSLIFQVHDFSAFYYLKISLNFFFSTVYFFSKFLTSEIAFVLSVISLLVIPEYYFDQNLPEPFQTTTYSEALESKRRLLFLLSDINTDYRKQAESLLKRYENLENSYHNYMGYFSKNSLLNYVKMKTGRQNSISTPIIQPIQIISLKQRFKIIFLQLWHKIKNKFKLLRTSRRTVGKAPHKLEDLPLALSIVRFSVVDTEYLVLEEAINSILLQVEAVLAQDEDALGVSTIIQFLQRISPFKEESKITQPTALLNLPEKKDLAQKFMNCFKEKKISKSKID